MVLLTLFIQANIGLSVNRTTGSTEGERYLGGPVKEPLDLLTIGLEPNCDMRVSGCQLKDKLIDDLHVLIEGLVVFNDLKEGDHSSLEALLTLISVVILSKHKLKESQEWFQVVIVILLEAMLDS